MIKAINLRLLAAGIAPMVISYVHALSSCASSKNPLDCANPACADTLDLFKKSMKLKSNEHKKKSEQQSEQQLSANKSVVNNSVQSITPADKSIPKRYRGCPADKELLGRNTWLFLHTMVANYPEEPSTAEQENAKRFIESFAYLYPCSYCATDFQKCIKESPPDVTSRTAFSLWMCEQHNKVNTKLGKPQFPCCITRLDERWLYGTEDCWEEE